LKTSFVFGGRDIVPVSHYSSNNEHVGNEVGEKNDRANDSDSIRLTITLRGFLT